MQEKDNKGGNVQDINEILKVRREKLSHLQEMGKDPYDNKVFNQENHALEIFDNYEEPNSVVAGLTITDGYGFMDLDHGELAGGGIYCLESSPTIINCIIRDNQAAIGGGIYLCWKR